MQSNHVTEGCNVAVVFLNCNNQEEMSSKVFVPPDTPLHSLSSLCGVQEIAEGRLMRLRRDPNNVYSTQEHGVLSIQSLGVHDEDVLEMIATPPQLHSQIIAQVTEDTQADPNRLLSQIWETCNPTQTAGEVEDVVYKSDVVLSVAHVPSAQDAFRQLCGGEELNEAAVSSMLQQGDEVEGGAWNRSEFEKVLENVAHNTQQQQTRRLSLQHQEQQQLQQSLLQRQLHQNSSFRSQPSRKSSRGPQLLIPASRLLFFPEPYDVIMANVIHLFNPSQTESILFKVRPHQSIRKGSFEIVPVEGEVLPMQEAVIHIALTSPGQLLADDGVSCASSQFVSRSMCRSQVSSTTGSGKNNARFLIKAATHYNTATQNIQLKATFQQPEPGQLYHVAKGEELFNNVPDHWWEGIVGMNSSSKVPPSGIGISQQQDVISKNPNSINRQLTNLPQDAASLRDATYEIEQRLLLSRDENTTLRKQLEHVTHEAADVAKERDVLIESLQISQEQKYQSNREMTQLRGDDAVKVHELEEQISQLQQQVLLADQENKVLEGDIQIELAEKKQQKIANRLLVAERELKERDLQDKIVQIDCELQSMREKESRCSIC